VFNLIKIEFQQIRKALVISHVDFSKNAGCLHFLKLNTWYNLAIEHFS